MIQIYYIKDNRMDTYKVATKEHAAAICKWLIELKAIIAGINDENGDSILEEIGHMIENESVTKT